MEHRIRKLNTAPEVRGSCVIYWMQHARRASWNHALEFAASLAERARVPLYVFFAVTDTFPSANLRHFSFMLQGLGETAAILRERGTGFILRKVNPAEGAVELAERLRAGALVTDCGHLAVHRKWRRSAAMSLEIPMFQVETDMVVPAWVASDREEAAAWTLRRKLQGHISWFLKEPETISLPVDMSSHSEETLDPGDLNGILRLLDIDRSVRPSPVFQGGPSEAMARWTSFMEKGLSDYTRNARNPGIRGTSMMSMYLHFGHVSPVMMAADALRQGAAEFFEQLVVRRELAINFTEYDLNYSNPRSMPEWAAITLHEHRNDPREAIYDLETLERAGTGDEYWNAAQREMVETGHMHGYMRMYWGKKVLQWTESPETAWKYLVHLNDRYQLDGRDPNGYAGIAWCFGKHDRPFGTFPVTGNIRRLGSSMERMRRQRSSKYNGYLRRLSGS